jgi:hypothetical protein
MESLEDKLERLSPEQRKEVEDFVDFLLFQHIPFRPPDSGSHGPMPFRNVAPLPLSLIEPVQTMEISSSLQEDSSLSEETASSAGKSTQSPPNVANESLNDHVSHDYIDYGQFEKSSPASDAVKRIRQKTIRPDDNDKTRHLLDWID